MRPILFLPAICATLALTACDRQPAAPTEPEPTASPSDEPEQSIIREGFEEPEAELVVLATLEGRIGFPEGGADLDDAAITELEKIAKSEQLAEGWPVVLRAHSDAGGNDAANIRASQARGDAVAKWLVEKGLDEDRITVIAFGEQNPAEPNANPDGTPNEAGRATNRRVDVTLPSPASNNAEPVEEVETESEATPAE